MLAKSQSKREHKAVPVFCISLDGVRNRKADTCGALFFQFDNKKRRAELIVSLWKCHNLHMI